MKRIRKLTIEIEQKEITMTFNLRGNAHGDVPYASSTSKTNRAKEDQGVPNSCPSCGLAGMLPIAAVLTSFRDGKYGLGKSADQRRDSYLPIGRRPVALPGLSHKFSRETPFGFEGHRSMISLRSR